MGTRAPKELWVGIRDDGQVGTATLESRQSQLLPRWTDTRYVLAARQKTRRTDAPIAWVLKSDVGSYYCAPIGEPMWTAALALASRFSCRENAERMREDVRSNGRCPVPGTKVVPLYRKRVAT